MTLRYRFLDLVEPLTEAFGKIHLPGTKRLIEGQHYYAATKALKPGDILMSRKRLEPTNVAIPGFFTHGAVYLGVEPESNVRYVAEAVSPKVRQTDLISFMLSKDYVVAVRPRFCGIRDGEIAAISAIRNVGKDYDYRMRIENLVVMNNVSGPRKFYCFELCWNSYFEATAGIMPKLPDIIAGEPTVTEKAFLNEHWEIVFDSRKIG